MLAVTTKLSSGPARSFGQLQEAACVSKVDIYLLKKKKRLKKRCLYVFSVIQLWLLLATVLVVGSFEIPERSKLYNDNLKFLVVS